MKVIIGLYFIVYGIVLGYLSGVIGDYYLIGCIILTLFNAVLVFFVYKGDKLTFKIAIIIAELFLGVLLSMVVDVLILFIVFSRP